MLMYGRKKNKLVNEWMRGKMCEVTTGAVVQRRSVRLTANASKESENKHLVLESYGDNDQIIHSSSLEFFCHETPIYLFMIFLGPPTTGKSQTVCEGAMDPIATFTGKSG